MPSSGDCKHCGQRYSGRGGKAIFCSDWCANAWHRGSKLKKQLVLDNRNCVVCGLLYIPCQNRQKYCNPTCKNKASNKNPPLQKIDCEQCGIVFETTVYNKKWCSEKCKVKASNERNRTSGSTYICFVCKNEFFSKGTKPKWCSKNCKDSDPHRRMRKNISSRISLALKDQNTKKAKGTTEYLGCSIKQAREYLEKKFVDDMSWDNYGKWHIDHKRPCASFDLTDPAQQKECFHYTNLQPLWAGDNIRKGNRWPMS